MKVIRISPKAPVAVVILAVLVLLVITVMEAKKQTPKEQMPKEQTYVSTEYDLPDTSLQDEDYGAGMGGDGDQGVCDPKTVLPAGVSLDKPAVSLSFIAPLSQGKHSSLFGYRINPVTGKYKFHKGYDIAAPYGADIHCVADGTVSFVGWDKNGYGNYLVVSHGNNVKTLYAHCSRLLVKKGAAVSAGQTIARVGSTGGSTGNHLHIEIEVGGVKYDPEWFFGGLYD